MSGNNLSGFILESLVVTKSQEFVDGCSDAVLPKFFLLKVVGVAGVDDFGLGDDHGLVVSHDALTILSVAKINHANIEKFE